VLFRSDIFNFIKNSNRKKKISELKDRLVKELFGNYISGTSYKNFMKQSDEAYKAQTIKPTQRGAKKFLALNNALFGTAVKEKNSESLRRYANNKENEKLDRVGQIIAQSGGIDIIHSEGDAVHKQRQAQALQNLLDDSINGIETILGGLGSDIAIKVTKETIGKKLSTLKSGFTNNLSIGFEVETIVEVSEGGSIFNRGEMANAEKKELAALVPSIKKMLKKHDWIKQEGSDSPLSAFEKVIINTTIDSLTKKGRAKLRKGKALQIKDSTSVGTADIKAPKSKRIARKAPSVGINESAFKQRKASTTKNVAPKQTQNWASLIGIINKKLPEQVARNMGTPGLVYRTGRFANSTKVVNVETTKDGYPSIVFDYQRNPYDVFDRTLGASPWNTPARDPRLLVDKSVREIVQEMAIGRFYTRRA
jgi:hypothetical protein